MSSNEASWWVVCLCAAWCRTCDGYAQTLEQVRAAHPHMRFEWIDIEDEAELLGDLEVETFPTLLVGQAGRALFFGPLLPQAGVLSRLLGSLQAAPPAPGPGAPHAEQALLERVQAARAA